MSTTTCIALFDILLKGIKGIQGISSPLEDLVQWKCSQEGPAVGLVGIELHHRVFPAASKGYEGPACACTIVQFSAHEPLIHPLRLNLGIKCGTQSVCLFLVHRSSCSFPRKLITMPECQLSLQILLNNKLPLMLLFPFLPCDCFGVQPTFTLP
jgi:hypothetical protein